MEAVAKSYGPQPGAGRPGPGDSNRGEIFALLGPNGAGKTTAVEILEGYRHADAGTVEVLGVDPASAGAAFRSRIGIVLQHTTSFDNTTVAESVEMFAAMFPDPLPVAEVVDLVDLGDQRDQIARNLSGGQRRRLDLACGLVGRPDLLFLDEPTTGLDPEARRAMWAIVAALKERGSTVLLTTHYLDEAEALADRIGILLGGRLAEVAEPDRVGRAGHGSSRGPLRRAPRGRRRPGRLAPRRQPGLGRDHQPGPGGDRSGPPPRRAGRADRQSAPRSKTCTWN